MAAFARPRPPRATASASILPSHTVSEVVFPPAGEHHRRDIHPTQQFLEFRLLRRALFVRQFGEVNGFTAKQLGSLLP